MMHSGLLQRSCSTSLRSQGRKGAIPSQFLAYLVVLCFERRCPNPSTIALLKSKYWLLPKFWTGYATASVDG